MTFLELAKKRFSVRSFRPDAIEDEKLEAILEAAHVAPTAANKQPHRVIVAQGAEALGKIAKAAKTFSAPLVLLVCADRDKAWVRPQDGKNVMEVDASIVTDHMMMCATDLGLGSCWITWFDPAVIKSEFALPPNLEPINILAVGYANCDPASPDRHSEKRLPLRETVFFETINPSNV
ncbi:MAG: nitroreductase family protein [Holophagales bacterium]|jgi:nitroreductase|nr:nitroreductase family protein [Holophagales bacterium]